MFGWLVSFMLMSPSVDDVSLSFLTETTLFGCRTVCLCVCIFVCVYTYIHVQESFCMYVQNMYI